MSRQRWKNSTELVNNLAFYTYHKRLLALNLSTSYSLSIRECHSGFRQVHRTLIICVGCPAAKLSLHILFVVNVRVMVGIHWKFY